MRHRVKVRLSLYSVRFLAGRRGAKQRGRLFQNRTQKLKKRPRVAIFTHPAKIEKQRQQKSSWWWTHKRGGGGAQQHHNPRTRPHEHPPHQPLLHTHTALRTSAPNTPRLLLRRRASPGVSRTCHQHQHQQHRQPAPQPPTTPPCAAAFTATMPATHITVTSVATVASQWLPWFMVDA